MNRVMKISQLALVLLMVVMLAGCSIVLQKRHPSDAQRIQELKEETRALEQAKKILEDRLKDEIGERKVHLELAERGLVITFVAEVLFDSGKAKLKKNAYHALGEVASVLIKELKDRNVGIEGHTDNKPIKYSGWKSNWELSSARATSVVHYLIDKERISPQRLSATGYGEYRPVASNATPEGRQKNRRVEIIIMPKKIEKVSLGEFYEEEGIKTKYTK